MITKNKNILSGGAVAFLLCLLFCMAVPLPLCAAGTLGPEGKTGVGIKGKMLQRSLLCLRPTG